MWIVLQLAERIDCQKSIELLVWQLFYSASCERSFFAYFLDKGFSIHLYEAKETVSKYVTLEYGLLKYTVRFSNHRPNFQREARGDCDFFVGVTHFGVTTARQAAKAALKFFGMSSGIDIAANGEDKTVKATIMWQSDGSYKLIETKEMASNETSMV